MQLTSCSFDVVHLIFKGGNLSYMISIKASFYIGLYSDIYRPISFKHGMMIETTKFFILISVRLT